MPAVRPFVVEPPPSSRDPWQVLAESERTGGLLTVGVANMPPRTAGPSLHVHTREDEATYVIEGELTVVVGEETLSVTPGTFVWLPRGVPHTFANLGAEPVRAVGMIVPGGLEGMFKEQAGYFASLEGEPPDPDVLGELGARYGVRAVGPPLAID
jgi:mannose-6-phosphate isomerase-like protein (cupin superfamily)